MRTLLSWLLLAVTVLAADIHGVVEAESRPVPISGALVVLRGNGREWRAVTDTHGAYLFGGVDANGLYTLETTAEGFGAALRADLRLASDSERVDVKLALADFRQSVVVQSGLLRVDSNAPEVSQTVEGAELRQLPTGTRSLPKFALLDPHVRQVVGLGGDGANGSRLSINAGSYRHTAYILDGVINYDWIYANGPYQPVALGAAEEMQVISNQYTAQYGTTTTGSVKVITRSGSNDLHGEAFGILRPSGLQAAPPLSIFRVPNERKQWGASAGGPLSRDKTFYFLNYEQLIQNRGAYIQSPKPAFFVGNTGEYFALARVDHYLTQDHLLSLRTNGWHYGNNNANDRVSGFNQPNYGRLERTQSWGGQAADRWLIGGVLNQFRLNFASYFPDSAVPLAPSVGITRPSYSVGGNSTSSWLHSQILDISDVAAFAWGRHNFKLGAARSHVVAKDYSSTPLGTYTFAAGAPQAGEHPTQYAQTFGAINVKYGETAVNAFVQDDFRISPRLSANLGLRYEYQSVTVGRNFAPRAGLAWDVAGDGKTTVRAGAGVFYDQLYLYVYRRFYSLGLTSPQRSLTMPWGAAGFPTYPQSLTSLPTGASAALLNLYLPADRLRNPYSLQYSLSLERQLPSHWVATVDGLYAHTLRQYRVNDINRPAAFVRTVPGQIRSGTAADSTRRFTTYGGLAVRDIGVIENSSSSIYDALNFGLRRKFQNRLNLEAHYVISSSATYSMFYADANSGIPNDWNNWGSAERAPSDFFQHHRFVASGTLELPWGTRFSAVGLVASGLPVNPLTGSDNNGDTYSSDRPVGFGRNSVRGPLQANLDVTLGKQVRLFERLHAEVRLEAYNVFNRNNYITLNNVYGEGPTPRATFLAPIAGINNTDPSRQLQASLRLLF